MKSYIVVYDADGNEIENMITHYTTLQGFLRHGIKNWIRNSKASSFDFCTFNDSSQLYSENFISKQHYVI